MSDVSFQNHSARFLKENEKDIIKFLLNNTPIKKNILSNIDEYKVIDMSDGNMGSIKFLSNFNDQNISFSKSIVEGKFHDLDGVEVNIALNLDKNGNLYELDFWKVDFSPLKKYPNTNDIKIL